MKSAKSRRQLTLITLAAALGVAVYLNWEYAGAENPYMLQAAQPQAVQVGTQQQDVPVLEALPDKNYGDAQLVSAGSDHGAQYFEQARLTRTKTRDEALEKMQRTLQNTQLTDTEKKSITDRLTQELEGMTLEADVENMVRAKGFADCVAFLENGKVDLAVKTKGDGLTKEEAAQLRDIVMNKTGVRAQDISIVEVK